MEIGVLATIGCGGENGTPRGWESAIVIGSMRESETETAFLHRHWTLKVGDCQNMEMKALCVSDYIFEGGSIVTGGRSGVGVSNGNLPGIRRYHRSSREKAECVQQRPR